MSGCDDVEAAWVYCPIASRDTPIELVRVTESHEPPKSSDAFGEGCVPMDGSWLRFSSKDGAWLEERGGNFWGYANAYEYAEDVFRFDPLHGRKYLGGCEGRELWPIAGDDAETLEEMGEFWAESLARCLAAVPGSVRGNALLRVPELLRVDFGRWCCLVEDSGAFERGPIVGTKAFREVVGECAAQMRLIPWARGGR